LRNGKRSLLEFHGLARKDARTKVGEYTRLAYHINNASHEPEAVERAIARIGSLGREKEYHIDNVVESLRGSDCYNGWGRELRYLLYRYEEYLAGLAGVKINKKYVGSHLA